MFSDEMRQVLADKIEKYKLLLWYCQIDPEWIKTDAKIKKIVSGLKNRYAEDLKEIDTMPMWHYGFYAGALSNLVLIDKMLEDGYPDDALKEYPNFLGIIKEG